jgi:hypothetical protein
VTEIRAAAGDVVIFAEACSHITLPWRAAHQRRVLLYRFQPGFQCSQYPSGVEPLPPPAWVLSMTPAQQAVMHPAGPGPNRELNQGNRPRHHGGVLVPPPPPEEPPPHPMMSKEQAYLFDLNGFLRIRGALTAAEVGRLGAALDRRECGPATGGMLEGPESEPFRELLVHSSTTPALNTILGAGWRYDSGANLGSEEKTEFHGGAVERSFGGNYEGYFFRGGRMFSGRVIVEFVLRDEGPNDGGLVLVPGSHKSNLEAPFTFERGLSHAPGRGEPVVAWDGATGLDELRDKHQDAVVEVNASAGDVVIFSESTTHAVSPWRGELPRRTLLYAFVPGFMAIADRELRLPAWVSELTPGQASRFEAPWRSSTSGGGLMARHAASLKKWQAKAASKL